MAGINLVPKLFSKPSSSSGVEMTEGQAQQGEFAQEGGLATRIANLNEGLETQFQAKDIFRILFTGLILFGVYSGKAYFIGQIDQQIQSSQAEIQTLNQQIAAEKNKLDANKAFVDEANRFEEQMAQIQKKIDIFEKTVANRDLVIKMVDFIILNMPKTLWLEDFELNTAATPREVHLKGYVMNLQELADYIKTLEGAVFYPKWQLVESTEQDEVQLQDVSKGAAAAAAAAAKKKGIIGAKKFELKAEVQL